MSKVITACKRSTRNGSRKLLVQMFGNKKADHVLAMLWIAGYKVVPLSRRDYLAVARDNKMSRSQANKFLKAVGHS